MPLVIGRETCTMRESKLDTKDHSYSTRLAGESSVWWKRLFDVQYPYRWNLRRLDPGFTLDLGCGIGRNLTNLDGNGVGIDHNSFSVEIARAKGLRAFTPEEFQSTAFNAPESFDSILLSHVVEHMTAPDAIKFLTGHLHFLKPRGRVIFITPQERGYRADPTHVRFVDFEALREFARQSGLVFDKEFSFPFPRSFGRVFKYNEFVSVSCKP
jgi:2-polyprenyl-3-methyl-5-hydroxy-6-metoxy-1,4-benzoquinol methylase